MEQIPSNKNQGETYALECSSSHSLGCSEKTHDHLRLTALTDNRILTDRGRNRLSR